MCSVYHPGAPPPTHVPAPALPLLPPSPGESAFSYKNDYSLGQPVTDRWTRLTLDFFEAHAHTAGARGAGSKARLEDMFKTYRWVVALPHLG